MNKYKKLFLEYKDFSIALGWADNISFRGNTEYGIQKMKELYQCDFSDSWMAYFEIFGFKQKLFFSEISETTTKTINTIEQNVIDNYNYYNENINCEKLDTFRSLLERTIKENLKISNFVSRQTPIFIEFGRDNYSTCFKLAEEEELNVYSLSFTKNGYREFDIKSKIPFQDLFRRRNSALRQYGAYFLARKEAKMYFSPDYYTHNKKLLEAISKTKIDKIPWLKFYQKLYEKGEHDLFINQPECLKRISEIEKERGQFLTIDEFESETVKYLIEEKLVEPMPDVFDPYSETPDYKEYFK